MANRLHVGTRKGLFELARNNGVWEIADVQFLGDPVSAAMAACAHADALTLGSGDNHGAVAIAQPRWDALLGRSDAVPVLLRLGATLTTAKLRTSEDIRELVEARMRLADRVRDMEALTDCLNTLGVHYINVGVPSLSRILLESAADLAREHHLLVPLARSLNNLTSDRLGDDLAASARFGREAVEVAFTSGVAVWISYSSTNLSLALFALGSWAEAEQVMQTADPFVASDNTSAMTAIRITMAAARGARVDLPWRKGDRSMSDDPAALAWMDIAEAAAVELAGDLKLALPLAVNAVERAYALYGTWDDFWHFFPIAARLAVDVRDESAIARLLEMTRSTVSRVDVAVQAHRAWLLGRVASEPAEVEDRFREALAGYEQWGSPVYAAQAAADYGLWLAGQGRRDEAAIHVERARETFTALGASAWVDRLESQLAPSR